MTLFADARGHFTQNALHLCLLFLQQAHQLVVLLNGLQRFDEHGLTAGADAMNDSLHAPLVLGFHRNDKAFAANGDRVRPAAFRLSESRRRSSPQGFLDEQALPLNFTAYAGQRR